MAEGLATVGAVASIVQLVDFTAKVISRLNEFHSLVGERPKFLHPISDALPVLCATLERICQNLEANPADSKVEAALLSIVSDCHEQIAKLKAIIAETLPSAGDKWLSKSKKAIGSLLREDKVENITKILRSHLKMLIFYRIAISSTLEPLKDAKLIKIREWLAPPDPSTNYQKALKQRQDDTGLWFLESDQYAEWKKSMVSFLWLYGIPGCGKTILSSAILQNILQHCEGDPAKVVAYFFFDFNDKQKQNAELMVRSVICQLSQQCVEIPASLDTLFSSCDNGQRQPSLHALLEVLQHMMRGFPFVYIVFDALDECYGRAELMDILETMSAWQLENSHTLLTSRKERDIQSSLEKFIHKQDKICLQSKLVDKDIQKYVQQRLYDDKDLSRWKKDPALRQDIETTLMKGAQGMFRWAVCQLDTLGKCRTRAALRRALVTLPPTLDNTYDRILSAISEDDSKYAIPILRWLTFAVRPLSVDEVAEVVAVNLDGEARFDCDEVLEDPLDVLSICSSMVTITTEESGGQDPVKQIVALAHYSVKEYLISDRIQTGSAARYSMQHTVCHDAIARSCLGYLLQFQGVKMLSHDNAKESRLADYSARFWIQHVQNTKDQAEWCSQEATILLSEKNDAYLNWLRIHDPEYPWGDSDFQRSLQYIPLPLYYASLLGLKRIVKLQLDAGADVNALGGSHGNALQAASAEDHQAIVQLLLNAGADVNALGGSHSNALQTASAKGHQAIVQLLLDNGADINKQGGLYNNALQTASAKGHQAIVQLLLDNGANINKQGGLYGNALHAAAAENHTAIVELLLMNGADVSRHDIQGKSVLHHAINSMHCTLSLIDLLLSRGAPADTTDINNMTPLLYCVKHSHKSIIELLLDNGMSIDAGVYRKSRSRNTVKTDTFHRSSGLESASDISGLSAGLTPLHFAALTGNLSMTKFLLERGADPNALSRYNESPIHLALRQTLHGPICQDDWADPDCKIESIRDFIDFEEEDEIDAVSAKIATHREGVLDALLADARISLTIRDYQYEHPLHCIQYRQPGSVSILQKLVSRGANPFERNLKQQNALHLASRAGDHDAVAVLISLGVEPALTDDEGLNALHYAAQSGNYETINILLETAVTTRPSLVASKDNRGRNLLHHLLSAKSEIRQETIRLLLDNGADGSELDASGNTPLAGYFKQARGEPDVKICQQLLSIKGSSLFIDKNGQNLGHLCTLPWRCSVQVLEILREHGVDLTQKDLQGKTILHCSAISGSITKESLHYLLHVVGIKIDAKDASGKTALQHAAEMAQKDHHPDLFDRGRWNRSMKLLLEHGVS
ncbi:hypothetical protein yc1106_07750 [Curvularia clavata]|uniref:NACHT domain-containing protein n=1 Tax=Curvularia clavata TaxID=95742 RepID=A0A9Q8ZE62_CURCL|nr:hypothetical protein yc1106_07750 [Curvularia clavata]